MQAGSGTLCQRNMVWPQDVQDAETLLGWQGTLPVIRRTSSGLQIEIGDRRLQKADELTALVRLGETLLDTMK